MNGAHKQSIEEQEKAKFSFSGATLYGINAVIGSGIFLLPQKIYSGLGPASLAVMFGVAILVMLLSACLAETAGYFDKNGGAMQYSKAAFGDFVGFNVGILGWAVTVIAWAAMLAGFAKIFIITFPAFEGYNLPISIGMLILLSLMNIAGLKTSKMFTLTATVAKLIPIVLFSLFAIFFISGGVSKGNFTPFLQLESGTSLFSSISSTAVYICSLHVDHRRNNRHAWWSHYANWCTSTRRICRNDWPYRSSPCFLRSPYFNRRSKHR